MLDPYHKWLGIPPKDQPPHHYRLLGIEVFESDREIIDAAADRLITWLQSFVSGPDLSPSQKLLQEIIAARAVLADRETKEKYDVDLRIKLGSSSKSSVDLSNPSGPLSNPSGPLSNPSAKLSKSSVPLSNSSGTLSKSSSELLSRQEAGSSSPKNEATSLPAGRRDWSGQIPTARTAKRAPEKSDVSTSAKDRSSKFSLKGGRSQKLPVVVTQRRYGKRSPTALIVMAVIALVGSGALISYVIQMPRKPPASPLADVSIAKPLPTPVAVPKPTRPNSLPKPAAQSFDAPSAVPSSTTITPTSNVVVEANAGSAVPLSAAAPSGTSPAVVSATPSSLTVTPSFLEGTPAVTTTSAIPAGAQPALPGAASVRLPIPETAEQEKTRALLKELLADSRPTPGKSKAPAITPAQLLAQAQTTSSDPVSQYVLLCEARDLAVQAADLETFESAAEQLARRFEVDDFDMHADAYELVAPKALKSEQFTALTENCLRWLERAWRKERCEVADRFVKSAFTMAQKSRETRLNKEVLERSREQLAIRKEWDVAQQAREQLKRNPDDPAAHLALGRYLCFVRGDWQTGLTHWARGEDETLKELASKSRNDLVDAAALVEQGDAWRERALEAKGPTRVELTAGAAHWYERALPWLNGVVKSTVAKRVEQAGSPSGTRTPKLQRGEAPELLKTPFDSAAATLRRTQWSTYWNVLPEGTNSMGMKFVLIPPGEFQMGESAADIQQQLAALTPGQANYEWTKSRVEAHGPQHRVQITKTVYFGIREVTLAQFRQFAEATKYQSTVESDGKGGLGWLEGKRVRNVQFNWKNIGTAQTDEEAVLNVSHVDAAAFCKWLSGQEDATYRLPTEAEWEYACRAGGFENTASYRVPTPPFTVGRGPANSFGLFDMMTNASEWCGDHFRVDYYATSPLANPPGPDSSLTGRSRAVRGVPYKRLTFRSSTNEMEVSNDHHMSFRIVRELEN